jgi:hypothetical protein
MLERQVESGDYVVYYSNIYQVLDLLGDRRHGTLCRVKLVDPSKTTKSVKKPCSEMCIVDKEDVLIWKIKRGY